jgi:hypothetical protein
MGELFQQENNISSKTKPFRSSLLGRLDLNITAMPFTRRLKVMLHLVVVELLPAQCSWA